MTAPADRDALIDLMARSNPAWSERVHDDFVLDAAQVLTAIEAAGCVVVPLEATEGMRAACNTSAQMSDWPDTAPATYMEGDWEEIIAASPYREKK